jgi:secreted PhoX family phosphatase
VLQEQQQRAEAAGIGRRVFIKGLAATGALVGGMAVAGSALAGEGEGVRAKGRGGRPSPFSQGWTSQPGRFYDDVSLPEGFTYDVVASYRDRIGSGEYFGYNNDFTAYFPLGHGHGNGQEEGCSGSTTSTPTHSSSTATPTPRPRPPARSSWSSTPSAGR